MAKDKKQITMEDVIEKGKQQMMQALLDTAEDFEIHSYDMNRILQATAAQLMKDVDAEVLSRISEDPTFKEKLVQLRIKTVLKSLGGK